MESLMKLLFIALMAVVIAYLATFLPKQPPPLPKPRRRIPDYPPKSRGIYIILGLLFGGLGFHNFYAGNNTKGVIKILLTITLIGAVISIPWSILELCFDDTDSNGKPMV